MTAVESWQSIARALGQRLEHQADNCTVGYMTFDNGDISGLGDADLIHEVPDDHADVCPFCADTVAYRRFQARLAGRPYTPRPTKRKVAP